MNETEECRDKPDLQNVQIHCLYRLTGGWSSTRTLALPWRGRGCEPGIFCLSLFSLLSSTLDHSATVPLLFVLVFLKVVTTLVDLLFIELMSYLSHAKRIYCQPIHLTHELKLCIQITRGRVHFNGESVLVSFSTHWFFWFLFQYLMTKTAAMHFGQGRDVHGHQGGGGALGAPGNGREVKPHQCPHCLKAFSSNHQVECKL